MKKISVIVPVYNTHNELPKCLESICEQTYKNLEIICIDDGSTDGSERIVDRFAALDRRVKVVHKINGGESSARNVGLKLAKGELIAFCDCDDWLDEDMYEVMVDAMESEKVDMVAASWYKETASSSSIIRNKLSVSNDVFGRDELLKYIYMRDSYQGFAYMWDKLYKRELLYDKQGYIRLFREELELGGDVIYLAEIALNVKRVKYLDRSFYHYNQRQESGSHIKDVKRRRDWLKAYEIVLKRFEEECVDSDVIDYVKRFMAYHSSNAAEIAFLQGDKTAQKEFQKIMELYEHEYIKLNGQYPERIQRYQELLKKE